jgi:hypothetical protein
MVNDALREACADILLALMPTRQAIGQARSAGYLLHGARTLQWAERFEYGDPVPADEVDDRIEAAVEAALDEVGNGGELLREIEALRALVAPTKLAAYDKRRAVQA